MSILELYQGDGFWAKKAASTGGGEWCGPCPWCGGKDRFRLWPAQGQAGKYWCRQCGRSGDAVQYLRERWGLSFREALAHLGLNPIPACKQPTGKPAWEPRTCTDPGEAWQVQARRLLQEAAQALWLPVGRPGLNFLISRGFRQETIKAFSLGWLPADRWVRAAVWGLPEVLKDDGQAKKLWLPRGLVIPMLAGDQVRRLRVRRPEGEPRYYLIRGSSTAALVLTGAPPRSSGTDWGPPVVLMVVESELDALLLHQEAGDLAGIVALGNAQARPDRETAEMLKQARLILVALDADRTGAKEAWGWWTNHYCQARRWPPIEGKDPGEMRAAGVNLRAWIEAGLWEYTGPSQNRRIRGCESPAARHA